MANQFASIWAVKASKRYDAGDQIMVALKSGAQKPVTVDRFLYEVERKDGSKAFYHLAAKEKADE